jgi:hypothetical protein
VIKCNNNLYNEEVEKKSRVTIKKRKKLRAEITTKIKEL